MVKKFICVILSVILLSSVFVSAEQISAGETFYTVTFDDDELPRGTDVTFGDGGLIYAENGELVFEAALTYPPLSTVLFPYRVEVSEYVYECDLTYRDNETDNCRFSLCFGALNDEILYQFTVKCDADAEDSVSLQYRGGSSAWKTISSGSLSGFIGEGGIDADKFEDGAVKKGASFHVAVAVKSGTAFGYIDGVAVTEGKINSDGYGCVGFNGRGLAFTADNVSVNSKMPAGVSAADTFSADIYTPETGVTGAPLVIQRDRNSTGDLSNSAERPGAVMMTVKLSGGRLHGYDGAVDLGELQTRLDNFAHRALPAFYVADAETAAALSVFLKENSINDAFVIVSKTSFLHDFKDNRYIRLIVDMSSRGTVSADEVYEALYPNGARTVLLSSHAATVKTVFELHKRLISVWVDGSSDHISALTAAVCGADAIVTYDYSELISDFEMITEPTVMRRSVVISDGGDSAAAPPDTLKGVISALDAGIQVVAVNVCNTLDKMPVLSPSARVSGMSAEADISSSYLSSLRALTYSDGRMDNSDRITTLEELLDTVSRTYPLAVLHLKINDTETAGIAMELAEEYGMRCKCIIVSENAAVLRAAHTAKFGSAYSGGPYVWDGRDKELSISSLCRVLTDFNSAYYADKSGMPNELEVMMAERGLAVYITDESPDVSPELSGVNGFYVSAASRSSKLAASLKASCDNDGRLNAKITYCDGSELDVTALCVILPLRGSVKLTGGVVSGDGDFIVLCPQTADDGTKYRVCSSPLSIAEKSKETETEPVSALPTDNTTLTVIIIVAAVIAAAVGLIILGLMSRAKRKKRENNA
ncbi:MAG: hypothetical protein IKQ18_03355 [Clostridia bacterium]|nr:hypothetical protein [Clostridia bacterium]